MALEDILSSELTEDEVRIIVNKVYQVVRGDAPTREEALIRSKTPGKAKSLLEFYDLVRQAIEDYERRAGIPEDRKVFLTEEEPDMIARTETITCNLVLRQPGAFGGGAPLQAKVKNQRPRLREEADDTDHPGYKMAINGYWYDNVVRFTCWAKTNKAANARALWFEDLMEEYSWWFRMQGVSKILFYERQGDVVINVDSQKWHGRPIDFFVKTERLRVFSTKKIEEIIIKLMTKQT